MKFFGNIEKTYKDEAGHLIVCGHASTEALDSQGEVVKREAMADALPDFMKFGNIREMHQPSAVGKALVATMDEKGLYLEAKIVDPTAAMKVEEGVYSGFSIGGKCTSRDPLAKNTITGLRLTEISVVDRPANPEATFTLFKLDDELPSLEEPVDTDTEKGMGHVADLAWMLKALSWLVTDQADEAQREGDASTIPAKLQAWLADGGAILQLMTTEEVAELTAATGPMVATVTSDTGSTAAIQMSATDADMEKKGAKFSRTTLDALISLKDTLTQCLGHLDSLDFPAVGTDIANDQGANAIANPNENAQPEGPRGDIGTPKGNVDTSPSDGTFATQVQVNPASFHTTPQPLKADGPEDLTKNEPATDEPLAKVASLTSELKKATTTIGTLSKRVAELENVTPAPSKVKLLSLAKAQDVVQTGDVPEIQKLAESKDPVDVMKAVLLGGGRIGYPV